MRIFVVDDDRDLAESLADLLEMQGHEVTLAHTGESAVATYRERDFDLCFMDVKLPGMNGVQSFLEFRRVKPDARVVMMTGYSVESLLDQAIEGGALGVLHKPFEPGELLAVLESVKPHGVVLVADDDPDFADSIEPVLVSAGYEACVARSGEEALARVLAGGIDCLVLDLRLPVLSGIEVYLRIREQGRAVPTVMVTAHADEEAERLAAVRPLAGCFLRKPFDPRLLLQAIEAAVT